MYVKDDKDMAVEHANKRIQTMNTQFPVALIPASGWESFLPTLRAWDERISHFNYHSAGYSGYQPRDKRGRFISKIGGVDDDLADVNLPEEY